MFRLIFPFTGVYFDPSFKVMAETKVYGMSINLSTFYIASSTYALTCSSEGILVEILILASGCADNIILLSMPVR